MLCKNPLNRLTKVNQIKNHVWFQNFNWDELITLNMRSAYLPKMNKKKVSSNSLNKGMKFEEYVDKFYKEYEPKCEVDKDKHEEFEKWYANY